MKKWQRMTLSLGIASSMLVPGFASAAETGKLDTIRENAQQELWKKLNMSDKEQLELAYKQQKEMKDLVSSDTVIVKYTKRLDQKIHKKAGVIIDRSIPALGYDVVKLSKGQKLNEVLAYYKNVTGVVSAAPSITYKKFGSADPKKKNMYHLSLLNIDKALSLAGNNKVTVAVIDTGMDVKHADIKSKVLPPYNVLDPAKQPFTDSHGTHVAGIIASEKDNGIGGHGINPNAKILPIDVFGGQWGTSDYAVAEGILYAVSQKADVINMSLGGPMESPILEEAVKKAVDAGITVVAAAGNDYGESISYPAAYEGVISVSATNDKNKLAEFSSYGAYVDIAAPGESVYSTMFDFLKGSTFAELSGTSMATPVVAGVASLIKSKYPNLKPHEVEAILKMTAKDLGEKGYDTKYGYGLVDPVKALQFNVKNLPKLAEASEGNALKAAKSMTEEKQEFKGSFTKPGDIQWYKVDLEEGEGIQAILKGADQFNYKLLYRFYPENETKPSDKRDINDAPNGKMEAGFYQAPSKGTLVIGVKDVYGNYNLAGKSNYELALSKEKEILIDSSSPEEPLDISSLPYNTEDDGTLTFAVEQGAEEADKDYFRFTVDEPTTIKFDLSAVPGVNSAMSVYFEEDFQMGVPEDLPPGEYYEIPYVQYSNNGAISEGEKLVFEAMPGMNYLLEVSAEPNHDLWYDYFFFGYDMPQAKKAVANSNIPYILTGEKIEMTPDEDGLPFMEPPYEEEYMEGDLSKEEYMVKKKEAFKEAMDIMGEQQWRYYEEEMVNMITENAVPYEIGTGLEGHIQFAGDEDYYKFTADSDSIYQFELGESKELMPWVTIMEYDQKTNDLFPIADISTWGYYMFGGEPVLKTSVVLEKGKNYYIRYVNERYQAAEEAYTLSSKKLMNVPADNDNDENKEIRAKVLKPGQKDTNHLVSYSDIDYYYYANDSKDKTLGLTVKPQKLTAKQKAELPQDVQNPLIPFVTVVEDTNRNMQIDENEFGKAMSYAPGYYSTVFDVHASFRAKKDTNYFLVLNTWGGISVEPYEIGLHALNLKDEDQGSVVKNNVPSKPAALKKTKAGFEAVGYMNAGINFGDKDFYSLKLDKYSKLQLKLETPTVLDGVITIYDKKGKKLGRYDHYGAGDAEVSTAVLPKGEYFIVVEDAFGYTSTDSYKLTITK
ncbi:S8 family peptidase [Cytobacillus oceanisediminis]|uniref:S8 family peptidase n=1 Tax=Cytobacillus oceanisediminis TaxID=665099 RepID=UPI003735FF91